jgi:hypothetical protein
MMKRCSSEVTAVYEYKYFENAFLYLDGLQVLTFGLCRCCSNSGSDQKSIFTIDRKSYVQSKSYMLRTRISSIMSILMQALNLRSSEDEKVDFAQSGKFRLFRDCSEALAGVQPDARTFSRAMM